MACPYFDPVRPRTVGAGASGAMLPLGDDWAGVCRAAAGEVWEPDANSCARLCNMGYARGACSRFPTDEENPGPDAVRFTIVRDDARDAASPISIYYVMERDHHPFAHGALEYSRKASDFVAPPPAETLHRQARAYVTSYLRRKAEAAGN